MDIYQIAAAVLLVLLIVTILGKKKPQKTDEVLKISELENLPYKQKFILTANEYGFYKILKKISDEQNYLICPKVGMKELFEVTDNKNYMKYFAKIKSKHIDFIICDKDLKPVFAIELDDKSHEKESAQKNDEFKNEVFKQTGIKLIRIKAQTKYTEEYIKPYLNIESKEKLSS